jgi:hypothetical protein
MAADAAAPPATTPTLAVVDGGTVCGQIRDDGGVSEVRIGAAVPDVTHVPPTGARSRAGGVLADHVLVEPGRGAVIEAAAAPGASGGAISVVTDLGRRYGVVDTDVLAALGYRGVEPLRLPASVVALVPAGQVLDPQAARASTVTE